MLYQRGLLLVAMQPDPAVVPTFDPNTDAVLVEDPMYSIDPSVLERNFVRKSISVLPHAIGRKLAKITFTTEVRGNGKLQSGLLADAPLLGRLFRACSLSQTLVATAAATVPFKTGTVTGPTVSWSVGAGAITVTDRVTYTITVSTGGASGTAKVDITPDDVTVGGPATTAVTLTTATPLTVGNKGVTVTPTWSGSLVLGQKWVVAAQPKGVQYKPITDNPEMVAFRLYYDGVLHLMDRARGTFRIEAKAGNFAVLTWEFTGQYQDMVDAAIPDAVYEDTLPSQVELAHCLIDGYAPTIDTFSMDLANTIVPRADANSADGYNGVMITGRNPTGGIDPEMTTKAVFDWQGKMARGAQMAVQFRVGSEVGNRIWFHAMAAQATGNPYANREGQRTLQYGLKFPQLSGAGDDEFSITFT
jgi:hypothetical protein